VIRGLTKFAQSDSEKGDNVPKTRVLLADGNPAMLDFISEMLADDCEVIGAVRDGRAILREYPRLRPNVVLLSMQLGDLSGIEVAQQLRESGYDARIVFVTIEEDPEFVKSALGAGASAYVVKARLTTDLLPAIRATMGDRLFVSPTLLEPCSLVTRNALPRILAEELEAGERKPVQIVPLSPGAGRKRLHEKQ